LVRPKTILRWHRDLIARLTTRSHAAAERSATTWAAFPRPQAEAPIGADFIETGTLTVARMYTPR
jgi:hypothetical protein